MLNEVCVQPSDALVILFLREDVRLEPMQRRGERNARVLPLPRRQHPKRRVLGDPLSVVGVFVAGQTAIDRLAKQVGQRELRVASGAGIIEMALDQCVETQAFVQLARE